MPSARTSTDFSSILMRLSTISPRCGFSTPSDFSTSLNVGRDAGSIAQQRLARSAKPAGTSWGRDGRTMSSVVLAPRRSSGACQALITGGNLELGPPPTVPPMLSITALMLASLSSKGCWREATYSTREYWDELPYPVTQERQWPRPMPVATG